jgi:hypothetical protein
LERRGEMSELWGKKRSLTTGRKKVAIGFVNRETKKGKMTLTVIKIVVENVTKIKYIFRKDFLICIIADNPSTESITRNGSAETM